MYGYNSMLSRIAEVKRLLNGQSPEALYQSMMNSNPAFADFVRKNSGKSPEQLTSEYGIDIGLLRDIISRKG